MFFNNNESEDTIGILQFIKNDAILFPSVFLLTIMQMSLYSKSDWRAFCICSKINLKFRDKFLKYLNDNGYSNSTTILYIRILTTILKHAKKRGVKVSDDIDNFKDDLKNKKTLNVR